MSIKKNENYKIKRNDNAILDIFGVIFALKNTIRTGWVKYHGIKKDNAETIAEHVFSTTVLSYLIAKKYRKDLDADKVVRMALFHEMGESIIGDIAMRDFPDLEEKNKLEKQAIQDIFSKFSEEGEDIISLWEEYEEETSPEGKFVKQIDKFEAVLQAHLYKKESVGMVDYISFIEMSEDKFFDKEILELIKELKNA